MAHDQYRRNYSPCPHTCICCHSTRIAMVVSKLEVLGKGCIRTCVYTAPPTAPPHVPTCCSHLKRHPWLLCHGACHDQANSRLKGLDHNEYGGEPSCTVQLGPHQGVRD